MVAAQPQRFVFFAACLAVGKRTERRSKQKGAPIPVKGVEAGKEKVSIVGGAGQTLYDSSGRPLSFWTQLIEGCGTGPAGIMWGNQVMTKKAWDMEVDIGEGQCRCVFTEM